MNVVANFFVGLREAFTLEQAERTAMASGDRTEVRRFVVAARSRRAAASKLMTPIAAVTLLREALELVVAGEHAARSTAEPHDAPEIVTRFLTSTSPTYVDDLDFIEAEALRDALEAEVRRRTSSLDTRSVLAIRALRYGRFIALAIAIGVTFAAIANRTFLTHDVALGKPVMTSGLRPESPPAGEGVVDGRTRGTFGVFTTSSPHPFVMIDLEKTYAIQSIRIYNRGDGWFDDGLPLIVDASLDGIHFVELARRTTHYDKWSFAVPVGTEARFVRVSKGTPGEIALNEIEVYARE